MDECRRFLVGNAASGRRSQRAFLLSYWRFLSSFLIFFSAFFSFTVFSGSFLTTFFPS
jgi:hypothetical protein